MRSMSLRSTSFAPVGLDRLVAPVLGERLDAIRRCARTTAFSTGWYGRSKKRGAWRNAFECVRPMKP